MFNNCVVYLKQNIVNLTTLSSLVAPQVVIMTTYGATSDDKVVKLKMSFFHCMVWPIRSATGPTERSNHFLSFPWSEYKFKTFHTYHVNLHNNRVVMCTPWLTTWSSRHLAADKWIYFMRNKLELDCPAGLHCVVTSFSHSVSMSPSLWATLSSLWINIRTV